MWRLHSIGVTLAGLGRLQSRRDLFRTGRIRTVGLLILIVGKAELLLGS